MLAASADTTLAHVELIARKRERLEDAQINAERAYLQQLKREAGGDVEILSAAYQRYRTVALPGLRARWTEAFGESPQRLVALAARQAAMRPNSPDGRTWIGTVPLLERAPAPMRGQSVVYVLYDDELVPCYVGSSLHFRARLKKHRSGGKDFSAWTAYPCADRASAYELEDRLLKEYKPYLNRRAGR